MKKTSRIHDNERPARLQDTSGPPARHMKRYKVDGEPNFIIESDLPDQLPVTREILDIMERYFGDIIDEVLGDRRP